MFKKQFFLILFIAGVCHLDSFAVKFANVFSDNMVLQHSEESEIWGTSTPNAKLILTCSWMDKPVNLQADSNGEWRGKIITGKPSFEPADIIIKDGDESSRLSDMLFGEVWLCSGQSNMEMIMRPRPDRKLYVESAESEIAAANYPYIRFMTIARTESFVPLAEAKTAGWKICSPQTVGDLSAVGYYFAKRVFEKINCPVGVVISAYGGSPLQSWLPQSVVRSGDALYKQALKTREERQAQSDLKFGTASVLYDAMINPLTGMAFRGFLWYQGEANLGSGMNYVRLMEDLIASWRKVFGEKLPFYYVQIAPFRYSDPDGTAAAVIRAAQAEVEKRIVDTGMAITIDIGESDNVHPSKKRQVGERLAALALDRTYHKQEDDKYPYLTEARRYKEYIELTFADTFGKLEQTGEMDFGIGVKGDDKSFVAPEKIEAQGDKIRLYTKIESPQTLRYNWRNVTKGNLFNAKGLPVNQFEADIK